MNYTFYNYYNDITCTYKCQKYTETTTKTRGGKSLELGNLLPRKKFRFDNLAEKFISFTILAWFNMTLTRLTMTLINMT